MPTKLIERVILDKDDMKNGVAYGSRGILLIDDRVQGIQMVWQPGSSYWSGWQGNRYNSSRMELRGLDRCGRLFGKEKPGRLSKKLIETMADLIDERFGPGIAAQVNTKKTLVIEM